MRVVTTTQQFAKSGAVAFGARIRQLRQGREWTQGDLAAQMTGAGFPLHQTTVAKLEVGSRPTSVEELFALAAILNVTVPELLLVDDDSGIHRELSEISTRLAQLDSQIGQTKQRERDLQTEYEATQEQYQNVVARLSDPPSLKAGPGAVIPAGSEDRDHAES